jgi:hypothetical protein
MKSKYKVLGSIALIAVSIYTFNTIVDYFIIRSIRCDENQQNLTDEQISKRVKNLNRAVENTVGVNIMGHDIPAIVILPKNKKVNKLRENLCSTDWDILADIYIETGLGHFERQKADDITENKLIAIQKMFLEGEDEAIAAILKNKIDNANISSIEKIYLNDKRSGY